jgi:hypothetical protein
LEIIMVLILCMHSKLGQKQPVWDFKILYNDMNYCTVPIRVNTQHSTLLKIGISCTMTILKISISCTVTISRIKICGWQTNSHFLPHEVNLNRRYCLGPELNGILPCYNHK